MAEFAYNGWYADDHGNIHFTGQSYSPNHGRNSPGTNYSSPYTSFGGASAPAVEAFPQGENLRWSNQPYAWSEWEQPHGSFEQCIDDAGVAGPTLKDSFRLLFATSDDFRQSMALRSLGPQSQRTPIDNFYDEWREEQGEIGERIRELSDTQSMTTILEPLTNRLPKTPSQIAPPVLPHVPSRQTLGPEEPPSKLDTHVAGHGRQNIDILQELSEKETGVAHHLNAVNSPSPKAPTQDLADTLEQPAFRRRKHAQEKLLSQSPSAPVENDTQLHYEKHRKLETHRSCSTPAGDAPDVPWSPIAEERVTVLDTKESQGQNHPSTQFTKQEVLHILHEGKYDGQNVLALVNAISELGVEDKRVSLGGVTLIDQDAESVTERAKHQTSTSCDKTSKQAKESKRRDSLPDEIEDQVAPQGLFQAYVEDASECGPEVEKSKSPQPVPRVQALDDQQRDAGKAHLLDKRKSKTDTKRSENNGTRSAQFRESQNDTIGIPRSEEPKRASVPDLERRFYLAEENLTPFRTLASRRRTGSMEVNLASIDEEPVEVPGPASCDETRDKRRRGSRSSSQGLTKPQVTNSQIPAMLESNKLMQKRAKELARPPTARGNHAPHLAEPSHLLQGSPEQLGTRSGHSPNVLHQLSPASGPISPIEPLPSPFAPATDKSTSSHPPLRRRAERLDISIASLYRATTWPAVDPAQGGKDADSGFERRSERPRERRSADPRTASSSTSDKEDLSSPNTSPASHPQVFAERDLRHSHHVAIDAGRSSRRASDAEGQRVSFESMQYMAHLNYMRAKYAEQRVDDLEGRNKAMKNGTRTTEKAAETWARQARSSSDSATALELRVQALEEEKRRLRAEIEGLSSKAQTSSRMQENRHGGDRDDGTRRRTERSRRHEHRAVSDKSRRAGLEAEERVLKSLGDEIHTLKREIKTLKVENVELVNEGKEKERIGNVWKERCRTWEKRFPAEGRAAKVGGFVGRWE